MMLQRTAHQLMQNLLSLGHVNNMNISRHAYMYMHFGGTWQYQVELLLVFDGFLYWNWKNNSFLPL